MSIQLGSKTTYSLAYVGLEGQQSSYQQQHQSPSVADQEDSSASGGLLVTGTKFLEVRDDRPAILQQLDMVDTNHLVSGPQQSAFCVSALWIICPIGERRQLYAVS